MSILEELGAQRLNSLRKVAALKQRAEEFLHLVVDDLCEYPVTFERFGPSTPQFTAVVAACKLFFKHSLFAGSTKETMEQNLTLCRVPQEYHKCFADVFFGRSKELFCFFQTQNVKQLSDVSLEDFNWSTHLTVAGDTMSKLARPVTWLDLTLNDRAAPATGFCPAGKRHVFAELDKEALAGVIAQLENAVSALRECTI